MAYLVEVVMEVKREAECFLMVALEAEGGVDCLVVMVMELLRVMEITVMVRLTEEEAMVRNS